VTFAGAELAIIDVDSHVTEPPDLWTSRMSDKWGDKVPHVRWDEDAQEERWFIGDARLSGVGASACAGWPEPFPNYPPKLADTDPAAWDAEHRLRRLDELGVMTQVLYPNVLGVHSASIIAQKDAEFMLDCVRAYNDFITEFSSVDPKRLVPLTMLPFWDLDASVAEIERCYNNGHRGIITASKFDAVGYPALASGHWDPVFDAAQALDLSINFHIGFSALAQTDLEKAYGDKFEMRQFVKDSVMTFLGNATTIVDLILSGLCDRYPRLNFVSVESGAGYIPYLLEAMDWQWVNTGCPKQFPGSALPSEVFRRQIYGTFWFENNALDAIGGLVDNMMFETDFPHPTSLSPGPASWADRPSDMAARNLSRFPPETVAKLLHDNAARVYHL
jgi:predicted TIM-barrel fold metal-dependent hydrolase